MKKWVFEHFNFLGLVLGVIVSAVTIFGFIQGFLFAKITLPVWLLLLLTAVFPFICWLIKAVVGKFGQIYKTKDLVNIIADERKFMVIRYHFWYPYHAICKLVDKPEIISLHQKYIAPYKEPEPKSPFDMENIINPRRNINTAIPKATVTKL